jgi:hypothetical protein
METESHRTAETTPEASKQVGGQPKMTRRDALALVSKHAVYTAPAVLAVLAATKSKDALAFDCTTNPSRCS